MVHKHWGLDHAPFLSGKVNAFFSESQEEAMARIRFLIDEHRRLGLLVGPRGVGKTALLRRVVNDQLRRGYPAAFVNALGLDAEEFLAAVTQQLELNVPPNANLAGHWRRLTDHLLTQKFQRLETVVCVDDIDEAAADAQTVLARMAQWSPADGSTLTLLASVAPHRLEWLPDRLAELVDLPMELTAWTIEDTSEFLRRELANAGRQEILFENGAIDELHRLTQGEPRQICRLADMALIAGAAQECERIDREIVLASAEELGFLTEWETADRG